MPKRTEVPVQDLKQRYFDWLVSKISGSGKYYHYEHLANDHKKLLTYLYERSFNYYILPMDGNRSEDGIDLRYSGFGDECGIDQHDVALYLDQCDCSMLEMMAALAIRAENIVGDPVFGDRTGLWFWCMVGSLGLMKMTDDNYDEQKVTMVVDNFINHDYKPDGRGGLFTLKNPPHDMRDAEIWNQMCWFLSENA